jgi:hypothetical protein
MLQSNSHPNPSTPHHPQVMPNIRKSHGVRHVIKTYVAANIPGLHGIYAKDIFSILTIKKVPNIIKCKELFLLI